MLLRMSCLRLLYSDSNWQTHMLQLGCDEYRYSINALLALFFKERLLKIPPDLFGKKLLTNLCTCAIIL